MRELHYDAFISYRHNEFDSFVAQNIQKRLENFRLPKSVLSKVTCGKTKIERVFRDVDELPLSEDLSDPISRALKNSDFLITICTPRYPQSRWCMKEIEVFLRTHPRDHILVVLAEDEPVNSFPEILMYDDVATVDENGNTVTVRREIEPLAADTRGENRKEVLKAMDTAVIKLCAAIFGLNYDDLKQRHREQRIRRLAAIFGSIGAAVLAFAVFAAVMLVKISRQNKTISDQYYELQDNYASSMASVSERLYAEGRQKDAVYAARSVLSEREGESCNPKALKALYQAMGAYKVTPVYSPDRNYEAENWLMQGSVSYDGKYLLMNDSSSCHVYDTESGVKVRQIRLTSTTAQAAFCGSEGILICDEERNVWYSINTDDSHEIDLGDEEVYNPISAVDGSAVLCFSERILNGVGGKGEIVFSVDLSDVLSEADPFLNYAGFDGNRIVCCFMDYNVYYIVVIDTSSGEVITVLSDDAMSSPRAGLCGEILYTTIDALGPDDVPVTIVTATDIAAGEKIWSLSTETLWGASGDISLSDDRIYVHGETDALVIDSETGELLNRYSCKEHVVLSWSDDYSFYLLTESGSLCYCEDAYSGDITQITYDIIPDTFISQACFINDDLYFFIDQSGCAIRYSKDISPDAVFAGDDIEDDSNYDDYEEAAVEILRTNPDVEANINLLSLAFFSQDKKYIFALFTNHIAGIYDAETAECVYPFETSDEMFDYMGYSDVVGGYILSSVYSYIFDSNMNIICVTERIVSEGSGSLIMGSLDHGYYKVPYLDPGAIVKKADDYLNGYKPSKSVRQKYGLPD